MRLELHSHSRRPSAQGIVVRLAALALVSAIGGRLLASPAESTDGEPRNGATQGPAASTPKPKVQFNPAENPERANAAVFSPSLDRLFLLYASGRLEVHELIRSGQRISGWQGVEDMGVRETRLRESFSPRMALLDHGSRLLLVNRTNAFICDAATGERLQELPSGKSEHEATAIAAGRMAAVFSNQGYLWWDLEAGRAFINHLPAVNRNPGPGVRGPLPMSRPAADESHMPASGQFALDANGARVAVSRGWGEVDIWNISTGIRERGVRSSRARPGPTSVYSRATALAFLPDGRLLVVFNHSEVKLVSSGGGATSETPVPIGQAVGGDFLEIHSIAVSSDGRRFALGGLRVGPRAGFFDKSVTVHDVPGKGEVQLWDTATLKLLHTVRCAQGSVPGVIALDASGNRLGAVSGLMFTPLPPPQ